MAMMFRGPIPASLDPERTGWPFRGADVVFGQQGLHEQIARWNKGRDPADGLVVYSHGMDPIPPVQEVWWNTTERTLPYLLWDLLSGDCRAFGDPEKAGNSPEWIQPRLWKDLKPHPQNDRLFMGGGAIFWNVRVVAAGEIEAAADIDANLAPQYTASSAVENSNILVDKRARGGRPLHQSLYDFVRELVRLADLDNLPSDQGALYRHMRQWSDENFLEGGPSDSTIRSWLAEFDHRRHQTPQSG